MDLNTTTESLNTIPSSIAITKLDNFPTSIRFRSETEAIERLCLKIFNAIPVYETDVEDFKKETVLSCPDCDALASHGVNDGPCEAHKL